FFVGYLLLQSTCTAQQSNYIKKTALGIHIIINDFNAADYIRSYSLSDAIKNSQFFRQSSAGLALSYQQGISNHFDFSGSVSASFPDYLLHDGRVLGKNSLLLEVEASLVSKLLSDNHLLNPYLQTGIGFSKYENYYGLIAPIGLGLQVKITNEAFVLLSAQYRLGLTAFTNNHFYYSIGVIGNLLKKKKQKKKEQPLLPPPLPVKATPVITDHDGDGVPDSLDACPDIPGAKQYNGCPDSDGDGIADNKDKCPNTPGFAKYEGCPVPDTDNDGVDDEHDSCRNVAGVPKYNGCPIPDSDGDSVPDDVDLCPHTPGSKDNHGCPLMQEKIVKKIAYDAKNIYFETGSYKLLHVSFQPLDDVIKILQEHKNLYIDIEGHTDSIGGKEMNRVLSANRANTVMQYLIDKGHIDPKRLTAAGFGLTRPVTDNRTAAHRALNRRVEMKLKYP
ncbi:MAG TPA: OmpA family protein, partial [Puia sp.]|nr:OmpA family protein [Puia sp.]